MDTSNQKAQQETIFKHEQSINGNQQPKKNNTKRFLNMNDAPKP